MVPFVTLRVLCRLLLEATPNWILDLTTAKSFCKTLEGSASKKSSQLLANMPSTDCTRAVGVQVCTIIARICCMPGGFTDMSSWKMALPGFIALTFSIISLKADIDFSVVAAIHLLLARIIACPGSNLGSILTIHSSGMKLGCTSYLWAAMTSCQHRSLTWLKPANFKFFYMAKSIDELLPSRETVTQSGSFPRCILALLCKCMSDKRNSIQKSSAKRNIDWLCLVSVGVHRLLCGFFKRPREKHGSRAPLLRITIASLMSMCKLTSLYRVSESLLSSVSHVGFCDIVPALVLRLQPTSGIRRVKIKQMQQALRSTLLLFQIRGGQTSHAIFLISALMTSGFGEHIEGQLLTICLIQKSFTYGHIRSAHISVSFLGMITKVTYLLEDCLLSHLHSNTRNTVSKMVSLVIRHLHERSNSESSPLLMLAMRSITRLKQLFAINEFLVHMPSIAIDSFGASLNWIAGSPSLHLLDVKKMRGRWVRMASGVSAT
mmetsp:Transcript_30899/g.95617  ORF Transcript_30899/g.95617 Transcript_30899/m.95617 type:complete len:490 (-) Transcript_30899:297-1766(-)